jgi:hypothetical protein
MLDNQFKTTIGSADCAHPADRMVALALGRYKSSRVAAELILGYILRVEISDRGSTNADDCSEPSSLLDERARWAACSIWWAMELTYSGCAG